MNVGRVGSYIRETRIRERLSLRTTAALAGVSIPYLSQIERGLRRPSADILQAIAKGLRISAETLYIQAGMLEEKPVSDVATSVMADLFITESQKKALLQIYQAFREETGRTGAEAPSPGAASSNGRPSAGASSDRAARSNPGKSKPASKASRSGASPRRPGSKAGGGAGSQAGSSPHPAPTRSSAPTKS